MYSDLEARRNSLRWHRMKAEVVQVSGQPLLIAVVAPQGFAPCYSIEAIDKLVNILWWKKELPEAAPKWLKKWSRENDPVVVLTLADMQKYTVNEEPVLLVTPTENLGSSKTTSE